jgi:hypothetical protein
MAWIPTSCTAGSRSIGHRGGKLITSYRLYGIYGKQGKLGECRYPNYGVRVTLTVTPGVEDQA